MKRMEQQNRWGSDGHADSFINTTQSGTYVSPDCVIDSRQVLLEWFVATLLICCMFAAQLDAPLLNNRIFTFCLKATELFTLENTFH